MGELFRGWKRKLGVATLLLACAFTAGWIRSNTVADTMFLYKASRTYACVRSSKQKFGAEYFTGLEPNRNWLITQPPNDGLTEFFRQSGVVCYWNFGGIAFGEFIGPGFRENGWRQIQVAVPYWSIVIPLTLLSAYLLLSKPRTRNQPGTERAIIPPTSIEPGKDPAIASAPEVAADH